MKVLLVDDSKYIHNQISKLFSELNDCNKDIKFDLEVVDSGERALTVMSNEIPDILILDFYMKGMNGLYVVREIKDIKDRNKDFPYMFVIMLISNDSEYNIIQALDNGVNIFLPKPINENIFKKYIEVAKREILSLREREKYIKDKELKIRVQCYRAINELSQVKDTETKEHIIRIGVFSQKMTRDLGYNSKFHYEIGLFAPLHDIGKVGIPDSILKAPRKLTIEEFEIMKKHVDIGYGILKQITGMQMAANIAYYHHEKYDGSGYPNGLIGEDIPVEARIVALVDVYDALRTNRRYKKAWSHKDTIELLREQKSKHFDPKIVDCFIKNNADYREMYEKMKDEIEDFTE